MRPKAWISPGKAADKSEFGLRRLAGLEWLTGLLALLALALGTGGSWAQADGSAAITSAPVTTMPTPRAKKSQEIAMFRITSFEGFVEARMLSDASGNSGLPPESTETGAGAESKKTRFKQSNLIYEVNLLTHGYIYHPGLLSFDLGGGPLIDKGSNDANGVATDGRRRLFNLHARAKILRDKPYNGTLYLDRKNENQSVGPAQQMLTTNTIYGADFFARNPVVRTPLQASFVHSESQGRGSEQVLEDRNDQLRLKLEANLHQQGWIPFEDVKGDSTLQYEGKRQDSISGSTGLPIQATSSSDDRVNLETRLQIGADKAHELVNTINLITNKYAIGNGAPTEMRNFSFALDLDSRHSDDLQTTARYLLNTSKQGAQEATVNSLNADASYRYSPDLSGILSAQVENSKATQVNSASYGLNGSIQYQQPLPLGKATVIYGFGYRQHDQQSLSPEAKVLGEHLTLTGTNFALLSGDQVRQASVVVSNLTRSQTFVPGLDYVLTPVGLKLRIQRVIGGNIVDGQELLVDYTYATGGTYALGQLDNTINLSWALKNSFKVFMRYMVSTPQLLSGESAAPLNPIKSTAYGAQGEWPLELTWIDQELLLGGNVERENRREAILPSKRASYEGYAEMALPWVRRGNLRLSKRGQQVDYDNLPLQGVRQVAHHLRLGMSPGLGFNLFADASRMRDTGAPLERLYSVASIKAKWSMRKLKASLDLSRVRESQGAAKMSRTFGQFTLRRDF